MLARYSDRRIIEELQGFDEESINKILKYLYNRYYPMAISIIKQYNGSEDETKDVFQESLIAFYENIKNKRFRGESSLNTYMYSTIRNIWITRLKSLSKTVDFEKIDETQKGVSDELIQDNTQELSGILNQLLENLGESCRNILRSFYYENCSMKELMENMGFKNEKSAKTQKYKCMQKLISLIEQYPEVRQQLCDQL